MSSSEIYHSNKERKDTGTGIDSLIDRAIDKKHASYRDRDRDSNRER